MALTSWSLATIAWNHRGNADIGRAEYSESHSSYSGRTDPKLTGSALVSRRGPIVTDTGTSHTSPDWTPVLPGPSVLAGEI